MSNFARALQLTWPYRWRFALSVLCALLVALLWGANLSVVFPVIKVFFRDQNLQQWIDAEVAEQLAEVARLKASWQVSLEGTCSVRSAPVGTDAERRQAGKPAGSASGAERPGPSDDGGSSLASAGTSGKVAAVQLARAELKLRWMQRMQRLIHRFLPTDRTKTLAALLALLILGLALKGFFHYCNETLVGSVTQRTIFDLRNILYAHSMRTDLAVFSQHGTSDLMARFTNDMETLSTGLRLLLGKLIREPLKAVTCMALACWLNWRLTLAVLALVPLAVLFMSVIGRRLRRASRRCLENMAAIYRVLQESFLGIKVIKVYTMEPYQRRRFFGETKNYYRRAMRIVRLEALTSPAMEMIGMSAVAVGLLIGASLVISQTDTIWGIRMSDGPMDPETLALLYTLLAGVSDPARKLSTVYGKLMRAVAAADRIFAFLDEPVKVADRPLAQALPRHSKSIELRAVQFAYPGTEPVLKDVELKVSFGETVAIVGPNGSGKTTLVSLIVRFYDPASGQVLIDGHDLRDIQLRSLRQQLAYVSQEVTLFDDTVRNNIAYGRAEATQQEIEAAAKRAYAHRFILSLPEGYETRLGEHGAKLSGGQRQCIALARAILRDPAILILDEPTSALDVESESLIQRALSDFARGRTTIVVTHRLGILQMAHRIVVMDEGRIVDVGRHDELIQRCRLYHRLCQIDAAARMTA